MRRGWKMKTAEAQKLKERFAAGKEQQESTSVESYAGDGKKAGKCHCPDTSGHDDKGRQVGSVGGRQQLVGLSSAPSITTSSMLLPFLAFLVSSTVP